MKRLVAIVSVLLLTVFGAAQTSQEPIKEKVAVVNVEVPIHVMADGQPVADLSKEDFKLYEGGRLQTINGFYCKRKKLDIPREDSRPAGTPELRYFVLVCRLIDYSPQLQKGFDYLFQTVFRPDDQVLIFANNKTLFFDNLADKEQSRARAEAVMQEQSAWRKNLLSVVLKSIEQEVNITEFYTTLRSRSETAPDFSSEYVMKFLERYVQIWVEYKKKYLLPDLDSYYYFSKFLEKIKKEKWVICFYQEEMYPRIVLNSDIERLIRGVIDELRDSTNPTNNAYARMMSASLSTAIKELNVADDFPVEEVSKLFYKVEATFHSIMIPYMRESFSRELEYQRISTDIENSLREITQKTGGTIIRSGDVQEALNEVGQKEDIYYVLTYAPDRPDKVGKVKVEVNNRSYQILYDNNIRADYINAYLAKREIEVPSVQLKDVRFEGKKLALKILSFVRQKAKDGLIGNLSVRIRIRNSQNQTLFDQSKNLPATKEVVNLGLDFNWLAAGNYDVLVDVTDLFSGKTCGEFLQPRVE